MRNGIFVGTLIAILMTSPLWAPARAAEVLYRGNNYFLTAAPGDWTQAEQQAEADGGYLASVHSAQESQFLVDTFLSGTNNTSVLWIGLHDPISNDGSGATHVGDFVWSDGSPVDYTNWNADTGEPNNYQNLEYWAAANWHYAATGTGPIGTWNDLPLDGSDSYSVTANGPYFGIVEVPAPEPSSAGVLAAGLVGAGVVRWRRNTARRGIESRRIRTAVERATILPA